uniref:Pilus assembly protein n=1 Tax=Tetraselmis sp. GSL018 TaxID=582737 RepID=A0A061RCL2_9CHLO
MAALETAATRSIFLPARRYLRPPSLTLRRLQKLQRPVSERCLARGKISSSLNPELGTIRSDRQDIQNIKLQILQHSATLDRGQLHDRLVSDAYEGKRQKILELIQELCSRKTESRFEKSMIAGEWELVYSTCQLFRSSPFFMAIQAAFADKEKSALFFKLHDLQVKSWGASTVGRVAQNIDFESNQFRSEFDTIIFALTVVPIFGWFKLLPTFGGRVISYAEDLEFDIETGRLDMELKRTRVEAAPGIPNIKKLPVLGRALMDNDFPVSRVWKSLPWNGGRAPKCSVTVKYVDDTFRIMEDPDGELFVYSRPLGTSILD